MKKNGPAAPRAGVQRSAAVPPGGSVLARNELRYRRLFETAKDGILVLDAGTGRVEDVNPYLADLLGFSRKQVVGKPVWELGFLKNLVANMDKFQELLANDYVRYEDLPLEAADGRRVEVEFVSNVYLEGAAKVIQCNIRDISVRKKAEMYRVMGREVLQILNEPGELKEAIPHVLAAMKTRTGLDALGIRLENGGDFPFFAQDGFCPDFLSTENTLIARGADGGACRDPDGRIRLECTCRQVLSGKADPANPLFTRAGSFWTNDSMPLLDLPPDPDSRLHPRNQSVNGGYASVALVPIRSQDRIVGVMQFNDRRKGCFTLELVELLEAIAAHVGAALKRKWVEEEAIRMAGQLRQGQKLEAVGRLAGGVAHDFNNLLMGIMGYAELCRDQIQPHDPIGPWIDEIMLAAKRSAAITRQLLAFARKQTVAPKILDLNAAVAGMFRLLQQMIGEDIRLAWSPGPDLKPITLDPSQLDQILVNLCLNARDSIGGVGEIAVGTANILVDAEYVAAHTEATSGAYVMLTVSDTGKGMDPETREHAFEPFFTTKEPGLGTGLGLATVYGIVRQNGGFVSLYSEPGLGATFKIFLPQSDVEAEEAVAVARANVPLGRGETILLVEDEKSLRVTCGLFLKGLGYQVLAAAAPTDALNLAAGHPDAIQLLVTDVVMPGMNGRQLAQQLCQIRPEIRVLFMSGYPADVIAQRGVLDKGVHFLAKPFTRDDLARKVRQVLEESLDRNMGSALAGGG